MKQNFLLVLLLFVVSLQHVNSKNIFTITGPEESYNQIRVVNESSFDSICCRLIVMKEDDSEDWIYGAYTLNGKNDSDSNTNKIKAGTRINIELPVKIARKLSYFVDYLDRPIFDIVVVHITDVTDKSAKKEGDSRK